MDISKYKECVSVIIPTYNRIKALLYTINSLINTNNTYFIKEIIIINDCSTDENYYKVNWKDIDTRINFITNKENTRKKYGYPSAGHNRKIGQKIASGEFVAFCDDDDCYYPNKLLAQLWLFDKHPDIVMSSVLPIVSKDKYENTAELPEYIETQRFYEKAEGFEQGIDDLNPPYRISDLEDNLLNNRFTNSGVVYRRVLQEKIGYVYALPNGQEDYNWNFRCVQSGKCAVIQQELLYYDDNHGGNVSYNLFQSVNVVLDDDYINDFVRMYNYIPEEKIRSFVDYILKRGDYFKPCGLGVFVQGLNGVMGPLGKIYGEISKVATVREIENNYFFNKRQLGSSCCKLYNPMINLFTLSHISAVNKLGILEIGSDLQTSTLVEMMSHPDIALAQYYPHKYIIESNLLMNNLSGAMKQEFRKNMALFSEFDKWKGIYGNVVDGVGILHITQNGYDLLTNPMYYSAEYRDMPQKLAGNIRNVIRESPQLFCVVIDAATPNKLREIYQLFTDDLEKYLPYPNVVPSEHYPQLILLRN
jgi:glycosyltransferase involved in cell wall biosynthesis